MRSKPCVLHLDVRVVAPENLGEAVEVCGGVSRAVLLQRLADAAGQAAGEGDKTGRVALEQLPVDPRLVVVALEVAQARELDQVAVALVRLGEQGQVRVPLRLGAAVVGDVDLAADQRLDAVLRGLAEELDGGDGADQINAVDGLVDTVKCGAGTDTVTADASDSVSADCENVTRV